jgi:hypothetical protein
MTNTSPLGGQVPISAVQTALDRLLAGEEVEVSVTSLGEDPAIVGALMLSLLGAELLNDPLRIRLTNTG